MSDHPEKPTNSPAPDDDAAQPHGEAHPNEHQEPEGEGAPDHEPDDEGDDNAAPDSVNHNDPAQAVKDHMRFGENPITKREEDKEEQPEAEQADRPDGKTEEAKTDSAADKKEDQDNEKAEPDPADADQKPRSKKRFWWVLLAIGGLFVVLLLVGIIPRIKKNKERKEAARAKLIEKPVVQVLPAVKAPDTTRLELPANTRANRETYLFARTDGFVEAWYTDLGARVRRGQLLALIATPELDQRVTEARANLALARTSYNRLRSIELPGAISQQELDQGQAQYEAQRAILNQLLAQRNFRRVVAPFSGIVTERNVEVGALVSVSNAEGGQLFKLEQTDTLRAFVNVPQSYTPSIRRGLTADVIVPEFPDQPFPGRVARDAGALAPDTRTLLTEVKVPNRDGRLKPGIFALVRFQLPRTSPSVVISANALVPSGVVPQVVVVKNQKVYYQNIEPGRDFGDQVEVTKGLQGGELLVINPSEILRDGLAVEVRKAKSGKDEKGGSKNKPEGPEPLYDPDRPRASLPVDKTGKPVRGGKDDDPPKKEKQAGPAAKAGGKS